MLYSSLLLPSSCGKWKRKKERSPELKKSIQFMWSIRGLTGRTIFFEIPHRRARGDADLRAALAAIRSTLRDVSGAEIGWRSIWQWKKISVQWRDRWEGSEYHVKARIGREINEVVGVFVVSLRSQQSTPIKYVYSHICSNDNDDEHYNLTIIWNATILLFRQTGN